MPRAKFVPTEKQRLWVEIAASCGLPQSHICSKVTNPETGKAIDEKTLRTAFRDELNAGMSMANTAVAQNLFKMAATGKGAPGVSAAKFWLMCRAPGWKPTQGIALEGHSGGPVQQQVAVVNEAEISAILAQLDSEY